jgi:DnaA family protein
MKNLKQLTLNLCLKDVENFTNFFTDKNGQLIETLKGLVAKKSPNFIYFWGQGGTGKTHLLNALCQLFAENNLAAAYLPLEDLGQLELQILDDMDNLDLLCIDDLQLVAKNMKWEEKIFHCFNNFLDKGEKIVIVADVAPIFLPLKLADLKSRMGSGLIFELHPLDDKGKVAALKLRAKLRGLELNNSVANFLLTRYKRNPKDLFELLEKLDKAALAAQRKLTIPFVKEILRCQAGPRVKPEDDMPDPFE